MTGIEEGGSWNLPLSMWGSQNYTVRGDHVSAPLSQQKFSPPPKINNDRSLMYKKPWLTYLCDVVCWIAASAVHRFEWNSSVVKAVIIVTGAHLNLSTLFMVSRFLSAKVFPEWRLNPDFGTQIRCPFRLNRCVPSIEVTDTKIKWTFFRDQILCPLIGGVPWIKVSQRRGSTVPVVLSQPHLRHCMVCLTESRVAHLGTA